MPLWSTRSLLLPAALVIGLLAPLIALSLYTFSLQREALEESFEFEIDQLANTIANGMVEPVWNLIPESGQPLLDSVMQDPRVLSVTVDSVAQGEFLSAERIDDLVAQSVTLERPVIRDGQPIGSVQVQVDTTFVYLSMRKQWRRLIIAGIAQATVVLAVVFVVMWLNGRLQRTELLQKTNLQLEKEIAERKQAQSELEASRDQLRLITDTLPVSIVFIDPNYRYRFVNSTCANWFARSPKDILGRQIQQFFDKEFVLLRPRLDRVLRGEPQNFKESITYPDGVTRVIQATWVPHKGPAGHIEGFFALGEDVTELAKAEEALHQSQKLEAVGQLTGGVAHDFNNLLAVIQGNADLLSELGGDTESFTRPIIRAAERGSELTHRLLAFSRRQPLMARNVHLGDLVAGMSQLLTRTLGETIEIEISVDPRLRTAIADPGQVENALLNLALNARHAMAGGGKLTIACNNAEFEGSDVGDDSETLAGDFVVLSVTDTGTGMSEEVKVHAFEPFFTTKEVGEGSGLGLSMVYGFAKQSGGHVTISSEEGVGTIVRLYLPCARPSPIRRRMTRPEDVPRGHGEQILVIEDDPSVRALAVQMLVRLGYAVVDVPDAARARKAIDDGLEVNLMLTDVVLPGGVSGPEFAEEIQLSHPEIKIIFMSGYPTEATDRNGFLDAGNVLLSKPFRMRRLATAIHNALAVSPSTSADADTHVSAR